MQERSPEVDESEPAGREDGASRWPRDRWISPTVLKTYAQCPKRVRLRHLDDIEPPWRYQVHLRKGTIAHNLLRDIAYQLRGGHPVIDETEIRKRASLRLPRELYPSEEAREASLGDIVRWVAFGRRYLERIPEPEWLVIENKLHREWYLPRYREPHTLIAQPDVMVQQTDEDGAPLIEIIDYKTGAIRPEPDPPVLMRFVARDLLAQRFGSASSARVRFTYVWLDHAEHTRIDLSVEHCTGAWPGITGQVRALAGESVWPATPSSLCRWCPYFGNICQEEIPVDA